MGYTESGIGYQKRDTSYDAAVANHDKKLNIRDMVHNVLKESNQPLSAEDIARLINRPCISVRPRITELINQNLVIDSGRRGKTEWGKTCILWVTANDDRDSNQMGSA